VSCLDGVRHIGGVSSVQALTWNGRTPRLDADGRGCDGRREGERQAVKSGKPKCFRLRGRGADRPVVVVKSL
jgi:hypothetical protein